MRRLIERSWTDCAKRAKNSEHDVWGTSALHPSSRDIAPQLKQKEVVADVSDDEKVGARAVGDDLTVVVRPTRK